MEVDKKAPAPTSAETEEEPDTVVPVEVIATTMPAVTVETEEAEKVDETVYFKYCRGDGM